MWNTATQFLKLGWITQEIYQLAHFFFRLITTGDISKRYRISGFIQHACFGFTERERATLAAALHLTHEENPYAEQQQHREPRNKYLRQERRLFRLFDVELDDIIDQVADQAAIKISDCR